MRNIVLLGLLGCGGNVAFVDAGPADDVVATVPVVEPAEPRPSSPPVVDAASIDAPFACEACCLNSQQWNCKGGNASTTHECTEKGSPAICKDGACIGLSWGQGCGFGDGD